MNSLKRNLGLILLSLLLVGPAPARAQEGEAVYRVTDIAVDVSADSAAQAKSKALTEAQRRGFGELLARLGAPTEKAEKASDDALAALVKAFEVQKERAIAKRYIATFTLQFKPDAVRHFLDQKGVSYTEKQSPPVVVLPVFQGKDHAILWEDRTPWRDAWDEGAKTTGLVPMIVPAGDLEDIAKISTSEALAGKGEGLAAIAQKYGAETVLVVVLKDEPAAKTGDVKGLIEAYKYGADGAMQEPFFHDKLGPASGKALEEAYKETVKHVVAALEGAWRQKAASGASALSTATPKEPSVVVPPTPSLGEPAELPEHVNVSVPVPTLAAWGQIRTRLAQEPSIVATHVISMTRGTVFIELQFRGSLSSLHEALAARGLSFDQGASGGWELRQSSANDYE